MNHSRIDFIITESFLIDGCGIQPWLFAMMAIPQPPLAAGAIPTIHIVIKFIPIFNLNFPFWNWSLLRLVLSSLTNGNWSLFTLEFLNESSVSCVSLQSSFLQTEHAPLPWPFHTGFIFQIFITFVALPWTLLCHIYVFGNVLLQHKPNFSLEGKTPGWGAEKQLFAVLHDT